MKYLIAVFLLVSNLYALAQKRQNVYFIDKIGKLVSTKDSAAYIRVIQEPDSGSVNYLLMEFYPEGTKKRFGSVSKFSPDLVLEGAVTEFYENGKRAKVETFVNNKLRGNAYYFYKNGKFQEEGAYLEKGEYTQKPFFENTNYIVKQYADTTGKYFLDSNGTGKVEVKSDYGTMVGNYLNGLKDGEWKQYTNSDSSTRIEIFEKGRFIKGKIVNSKGVICNYNTFETVPTFPGGMKAFNSFLSKNLMYPTKAIDNDIKGRVFVQYVIEADGSLTEPKVIRGIGGGCDEEALRVLNKSPKWIPGMQRGKALRVSFTLPIIFNLEEKKPPFPRLNNTFGNSDF